MKQTLTPRTLIDSEGKIHYNESNQSWGQLILKKEIVDEFPQLKEKMSKFSYKIIYHRTLKEFLKEIKKLNNEEVMPMLLWLHKET